MEGTSFKKLRVHYSFLRKWLWTDFAQSLQGLSEKLLMPRSSVRFLFQIENSASHGFELHRLSIKGTKLLMTVIKLAAIIIIGITKGHSKQTQEVEQRVRCGGWVVSLGVKPAFSPLDVWFSSIVIESQKYTIFLSIWQMFICPVRTLEGVLFLSMFIHLNLCHNSLLQLQNWNGLRCLPSVPVFESLGSKNIYHKVSLYSLETPQRIWTQAAKQNYTNPIKLSRPRHIERDVVFLRFGALKCFQFAVDHWERPAEGVFHKIKCNVKITCQTRFLIKRRHCAAAFFLQVSKLCTDVDQSLLYIALLRTYSTFAKKNKMLTLGVCFPQPCSSAGGRFAVSTLCLNYYRKNGSFFGQHWIWWNAL